jgi:hypothetical protein
MIVIPSNNLLANRMDVLKHRTLRCPRKPTVSTGGDLISKTILGLMDRGTRKVDIRPKTVMPCGSTTIWSVFRQSTTKGRKSSSIRTKMAFEIKGTYLRGTEITDISAVSEMNLFLEWTAMRETSCPRLARLSRTCICVVL